jgi:hypothetical protein
MRQELFACCREAHPAPGPMIKRLTERFLQ